MKLIKNVPAREVKRAFLISDAVRKYLPAKYRHGQAIPPDVFRKSFQKAKKEVLLLGPAELDERLIAYYVSKRSGKKKTYVTRLDAYTVSDWYLGEVTPAEAGVWRRAGELPLRWTNGTLEDTAESVLGALKRKQTLPGRAGRTIAHILMMDVHLKQKERYLLPIMFKGNTGTRGRARLKRVTKVDIDDGNMRSIALAVHGAKTIRAYIGFPKGSRIAVR